MMLQQILFFRELGFPLADIQRSFYQAYHVKLTEYLVEGMKVFAKRELS